MIQELNETVCRQEQVITRLERQVRVLVDQLRSFAPSSIFDQDGDERPPHY